MKAIRVAEFGGPEVLKISDVPDLSPASGQVVVEIKAVGVNPVDAYIRSGQYGALPELPYTPGMDAAGTIKSVGKNVREILVGDSVFVSGSLSGTYAAECLCQAEQVFGLPSNISYEQGAALGVPYGTAYRALFTKAKATANETVLVHGGSGGVGIAAVQLAKAAGLNVIATAGSDSGRDLLKKERADFVLDHNHAGYLEKLTEITQGKGVDVILEMLANVNLAEDLKIATKNGRVVVIGSRGPVEINPRDAMAKELTIQGMLFLSATTEEKKKIYSAIQSGITDGHLRPVIGKKFPLFEAPKSHQAVMEKGAYGKIVLLP